MHHKPVPRLRDNPLTLIEFVIALSTIVGGSLLLVGATNRPFTESLLVETVSGPILLTVFALVFFISAGFTLIGLWEHNVKWRSIGMFGNIIARIYAIIVTVLVSTQLQVWNLTVLVISVIVWIAIRSEVRSE